MAQFDVYANPSKNTRAAFPYIVDVQNSVISDIATRIVIPLGIAIHFKNEKLQGLTPELSYEGEQLLLLTPQVTSMPAKLLKKPIGSLSHFRDEIVAALDFAITGI
ncbi:MAG: CcdB family protein [Alishewanella agri]|nr:CcdB family protein [Alishewanella agri]